MLTIELSNEQESLAFDETRLKQAAEGILREAGFSEGSLSIAIVDDPTIHQLNRQFLAHDYPTDVLSFLLEHEGSRLEGEVIASADTALRTAQQLGWPAADELLLYVVHGTLHLIGHDDATDDLRAAMRAAERRCLARFGIELRDGPAADV
jgi:probable rRNA maturation factor